MLFHHIKVSCGGKYIHYPISKEVKSYILSTYVSEMMDFCPAMQQYINLIWFCYHQRRKNNGFYIYVKHDMFILVILWIYWFLPHYILFPSIIPKHLQSDHMLQNLLQYRLIEMMEEHNRCPKHNVSSSFSSCLKILGIRHDAAELLYAAYPHNFVTYNTVMLYHHSRILDSRD